MQRVSVCYRYRGCATAILSFLLVLSFKTSAFSKEAASAPPEPVAPLAESLGVEFVDGTDSSLILERDGRRYLVDLESRTIREEVPGLDPAVMPSGPTQAASGADTFRARCASCHGGDGKGLRAAGTPDLTDFRSRRGIPTQAVVDAITSGRSGTSMQAFSGVLSQAEIRNVALYVQSLSEQNSRPDIYEPADDLVYSLPTGRSIPKGAMVVNFTHRFPYNPTFKGAGLGNTLAGLDGFSISSFGFRYGVTDKLSVSAYRSPSIIGRPIEFMAAINVLDEYAGHPLNAALRLSVDGQDHFRRNFTTNIEGVVSRSITGRAQFYAVPTISFQNRRLLSKPGQLQNRPAELPGINSFSLGAGLAVNLRPTVALVAEVIPTLVNGDDLGIHRPAYSFGVQKQIRGHAFTLGFSNGPGSVVSQRAGTRATFLGDPTADKPAGLFIGFNLMRRLH